MNYSEFSHRYIPIIAVATAVLVLTCLALNVCYQAKRQARVFADKATVAVFLTPDAVADTVASRLMSTRLVLRTDFFSKEAVYEKMSGALSPIKEMLVPGENPFSPYGLVYLKDTTSAHAMDVASAALKIDGVQDARFDEELFATTERLAFLRWFYQTGLLMVFVVLSLVAGFQIINSAFGRRFDYYLLGMMALCGIISALLAIASYILLVRYCAAETSAAIPLKYLLTMFPGGILLSVVLGLKR
jgi:cell division protein FtsX